MEEKFRKEKEEAEKLKNLAKLDRKEKAQEEKPGDSQGKTLVFGAQTKCFKDIGVDLNNQRRG
ncbi:MAG: hypothetical protein H6620_12245 [Halobacteriovoraceae bacterium]|nr:hypothetical protein [Halobacteriovoraceae bacterium]